jgi:hypothetical protein
MIRPIFVLSSGLVSVFAVLLAAFHLLPSARLVDEVFGIAPKDDACTMPCWYGVQPGVTVEYAVLTDLKDAGWTLERACNAAVYETCHEFRRGTPGETVFVYLTRGRVIQVALFHDSLTLSDLWLAFGAPDYALIPPNRGFFPSFDTAFWFGSSRISVRLRVDCPASFRDLLEMPIRSVLMWNSGTAMGGATGNLAELRQSLRLNCRL